MIYMLALGSFKQVEHQRNQSVKCILSHAERYQIRDFENSGEHLIFVSTASFGSLERLLSPVAGQDFS